MAGKPASKQIAMDPQYDESLLLDQSMVKLPDFAAGVKLLRTYSRIPEDKIAPHVIDIQRRAYRICRFPCIALLRFLECPLSEHALYPTILTRLKSQGATFLDLGSCFSQDIRKLAADGAPTKNITAMDIEPRFFELSQELFKDDDGRIDVDFRAGDIFDDAGAWRDGLEGKQDIIYMTNFLHLFGLEKQSAIARRVCKMIRPVKGNVVLGVQVAARGKAEHIPLVSKTAPTWCHSLESLRTMWDEAGKATGLIRAGGGMRWEVQMGERELKERHRQGLIADERLREVVWSAMLVEDE